MDRHSRMWDDDEKIEDGQKPQSKKEWECPSCNANNPTSWKSGDNLMCGYCALTFKVLNKGGRYKFVEI
jgi:transcription elongation factor Elf1